MGSETSVRILFIFALLLVIGRSTPAWARSYQVSQFTSAVHVQKDGSADI